MRVPGLELIQRVLDGGALGTVHATRAPQLRSSFLPEARILEATVLFHACLYGETRNILDGFTAVYRPLSDRLPALVDRRPSAAEEVALLADEQHAVNADRIVRVVRPMAGFLA